jgi:CRISPR-associated protein Cas2
MFYLVTYDVADDRRRRQVATLLEGYGRRVQWSVFECVLDPAQFDELRRRLKPRIRLPEDSVRFYPLSAQMLRQVVVWGEPPLTEPPGSIIV